MKRSILVSAIAYLCLIASSSWAASNLNLSKSNVNRNHLGGAILSANATLSGPSETQIVYTTPEKGDFILTQICISPVAGGMDLMATGFGPIVHVGDELCRTFSPGVSVPRSSEVSCSTTASATRTRASEYFCTISGLLHLPGYRY
jgi:hypothetical protein